MEKFKSFFNLTTFIFVLKLIYKIGQSEFLKAKDSTTLSDCKEYLTRM